MPRDEPQQGLPTCLSHPQVLLVGRVDERMIERFHEQLGQAHKESGDIAVEMTTLGGDADLARRLALDVAAARKQAFGPPALSRQDLGLFSRHDRHGRVSARGAVPNT